ncbi:MAG TPA: ABC transporter permease [Terriglobia bacterium]|nr:ABC transporter permease [Terriglobia bacterium]
MTGFLARRLALALPVVWVVVSLVFGLIHFVPGDPVAQMLGDGAAVREVARVRHELGLDRPIAQQYAAYITGLLRGDLGISIRNQAPVWEVIRASYPATVELTVAALLFSLITAIPMGAIGALRRNSLSDRMIGVVSLAGIAIPNFALGPLLILAFSIGLGLLPVSGRAGAMSVILPAITLGGGLAAMTTRMTRASLIEELSRDYVRTARAKGLSETAAVFRHAFRNGLVPLITTLGLQTGSLLAGAVVTETIFAWPGVGRLTVQAINARDYPLAQGCILVIALSYIAVNLVTDALYALADPRIRHD